MYGIDFGVLFTAGIAVGAIGGSIVTLLVEHGGLWILHHVSISWKGF